MSNQSELNKLLSLLSPEELSLWETMSSEEREAVVAAMRDSDVADLLKQKDWTENPVPPEEFFSDPYFCGKLWFDPVKKQGLYPQWKEELCYVLDPRNRVFEWICSGALGGGKTLSAVASGLYTLYRTSLLRNPHEYLGIMEDTPIEFLVMNVNLAAAEDTAMGYFETFLSGSQWFREHFPENRRKRRSRVRMSSNDRRYEAKGEYALELPPSFNIVQGSGATHSIGRNILWGLLDEANFLQRSGKDAGRFAYGPMNRAYSLYTGLFNRIESRFLVDGRVTGLLILISSAASEHDFLEQHKQNRRGKPHVHISEFSRWQASPWRYSTNTFRVFVGGRTANSRILGDDEPIPNAQGKLIEVPIDFRNSFERDLSLALREVAGIPSDVISPLIPVKEQIAETVDPSRTHPFTEVAPVVGHLSSVKITDFILTNELVDWKGKILVPKRFPDKARFIHIDLGLTNDSAGFAMGCVHDCSYSLVEDADGNSTLAPVPHIWVDMMLKITPPRPPEQIGIYKIREFVKYLRDVLHYPIAKVTFDGFQSSDSRQLLQTMGFVSELLSVDRDVKPYRALRGAVMEKRLNRYAYLPFEEELALLQVDLSNGKTDHPPGGSKDISDAVAGVVWACVEEVMREGNHAIVAAQATAKKVATQQMTPQVPQSEWNHAVGDDYSLI